MSREFELHPDLVTCKRCGTKFESTQRYQSPHRLTYVFKAMCKYCFAMTEFEAAADMDGHVKWTKVEE